MEGTPAMYASRRPGFFQRANSLRKYIFCRYLTLAITFASFSTSHAVGIEDKFNELRRLPVESSSALDSKIAALKRFAETLTDGNEKAKVFLEIADLNAASFSRFGRKSNPAAAAEATKLAFKSATKGSRIWGEVGLRIAGSEEISSAESVRILEALKSKVRANSTSALKVSLLWTDLSVRTGDMAEAEVHGKEAVVIAQELSASGRLSSELTTSLKTAVSAIFDGILRQRTSKSERETQICSWLKEFPLNNIVNELALEALQDIEVAVENGTLVADKKGAWRRFLIGINGIIVVSLAVWIGLRRFWQKA